MLNLFREFTELHLTGADSVPHRLALYLGANEIILGQGPIVFPLTILTPSTLSPVSGVVGTSFTYRTPVFDGSGPIQLSTVFRVGNNFINPTTGQIVQDEADATLTGSGPFSVYPTVAGPLSIRTSAVGADGITVFGNERTSTVTVPAPPTFTQEPSVLPNPATAGDLVNINPGSGPGLTWTLTYNNVQVTSQVSNLQYRPPANTTGLLRLSSTITNAGGSVTRITDVQVNAAGVITPPPEPEMVIEPTLNGFTVTNAGISPAVSDITTTENGFTVQMN